MKVFRNAITVIVSYALSANQGASAVKVGDEVCITGYVVDNFCIELGNFLDNPSVKTLEHPEEHSFHCLLDVESCRDGGYQVLGEKNGDTGMHCLGFRLNDTDAVVAAGQSSGQSGYCTSCTGDSAAPEYGWLATVKGTIVNMGDGSNGITGTPILNDVRVLSSDVECNRTTVPPLCVGTAPTPTVPTSSTSAPSPATTSVGTDLHVITSYVLLFFSLMYSLLN
eukprot:CCRYP_015358-RA/>CCRYP_015358-RA protein AED:0.09 eAED:-0.09 QI:0/-1/0/1/-1/1/1/0/223